MKELAKKIDEMRKAFGDCYKCATSAGEQRAKYLKYMSVLDEIEKKVATCETCIYYIGGGDWNLCCQLKYDLCYKHTPACDKYKGGNYESDSKTERTKS